MLDKKGEKLNEFIETKIIQLEHETSSAQNKNVLAVKVIENRAEKPDERPYQLRDYQYPEFKDGFHDNHYDNFHEQLFFQVTFLYDFDEKTSEIKLNNREEILLKIRSMLEEKGFNKKGIDRNTEDFNTKAIPQLTKYVQSLYKINSEIIDPSVFEQKLVVKDSISTVTVKRFDKEPGLYSVNYSVNMADRYLIKF